MIDRTANGLRLDSLVFGMVIRLAGTDIDGEVVTE
jgi:hypothetical protein